MAAFERKMLAQSPHDKLTTTRADLISDGINKE
jgi:hypothetical protein